MSYLAKKLTAGEQLIYTGKLHWMMFFGCFIRLGILFALVLLADHYQIWGYVSQIGQYRNIILAGLFLVFFVLPFLRIFVIRQTTEIVITDQRLICKAGLISVDMQGMPLNKVENIDSNQSIMGRILGYGDITIKGSGSTPITIYNLGRLMKFRMQLASLLNQVTENGRT